MTTLVAQRSAEARSASRSNMFIAAVLQGPGFSTPVKVRNMSATGAFVEAAAVPQPGTQARLVRGSLAMPCAVAWSEHGRCGLQFASLACVRQWLAPAANTGQQRVDEMVGLLKQGVVPMPQRSPAAGNAAETAPGQLAADLHRVTRLIEALASDLLADSLVLERHSARLQSFDIAVQTLTTVADVLAGVPDEQAAGNRLTNLRASCTQALRAH